MKTRIVVLLFIVIIIAFFSIGCNIQKGHKDELSIQNLTDYYISYYSTQLEKRYKEAYAAYLYINSSETIESFKAQYEKSKDFYEFKDITGDGIEEFIVVTDNSKSTDNFKRPKSIEIFTIDKETKEISLYLMGEYWDNFYYNQKSNLYVSKYHYDDTIVNLPVGESTNIVVYSIMELNDSVDYYAYMNKIQNNIVNNTYLFSFKDYDLFTRDEILNGNMTREEAGQYLDDLEEIVFHLSDMSDLFNQTYEDSMLKEIDKKLKGYSEDNSNIDCTSGDVDKIIQSLEQGNTVKISMDGDIKVSKDEGLQYYNKEYPYFTQYTISCGSYSRTIRISHK